MRAPADVPRISLSPETPQSAAQVAARALELVKKQGEHLLTEYRRRFGNVLSADNAAELFPDYAASLDSRTKYRAAVHPASQWVRDQLFDRTLARPDVKEVVFMAGGNGAGKTTAGVTADVVLDSTFSDPADAAQRVQRALNAEKRVHIVYTYRPIEEAFQGVLNRSLTQGRIVPIEMVIESHKGIAETVQQLYTTYADDPRVRFTFIDNSSPQPQFGTIALTEKQNYRGIKPSLHAILEANRSQLPEAIYQRAKAGRE